MFSAKTLRMFAVVPVVAAVLAIRDNVPRIASAVAAAEFDRYRKTALVPRQPELASTRVTVDEISIPRKRHVNSSSGSFLRFGNRSLRECCAPNVSRIVYPAYELPPLDFEDPPTRAARPRQHASPLLADAVAKPDAIRAVISRPDRTADLVGPAISMRKLRQLRELAVQQRTLQEEQQASETAEDLAYPRRRNILRQ